MRYSFTSSRISQTDNALFPDELVIDTTTRTVVFRKGKIIGHTETLIHFDSISSVERDKGLLFSDVRIETRGGKMIVAHGFTHSDARQVVNLLS